MSIKKYSFIITGGGTGGHLVIAKTLTLALKEAGHSAIFIGSTSGQDRSWFEGKDYFKSTHFFHTTGVVNQKGIRKFIALWYILRAFVTSLSLVKECDAVISVGGFSAAPASLAAIALQKPFFIHEQNATIGRLNKILKSKTTAFYSSYDENSPISDYPINNALFHNQRIRKEIKTIIFLGGSQGATFINNLALKLLPALEKRAITIIHQCGKIDLERLNNIYKKSSVNVECFDFTQDLTPYIERADFAISRSGASTLWELSANGVPAFFVPYPYAANDHQYANAQFLVKKGLAWCERESEELHLKIATLLDNNLKSKSQGLIHTIKNSGAQKIVNDIITKLQ